MGHLAGMHRFEITVYHALPYRPTQLGDDGHIPTGEENMNKKARSPVQPASQRASLKNRRMTDIRLSSSPDAGFSLRCAAVGLSHEIIREKA